jgi:glutathione S-transferase
MELHCFGESGNAYKAALPLELSGLDWTPVFVDFFHGAARSPEFRKLNPMGEVPVLEKTGKFGGDGPDERREVWRWVLFDNHKVSGVAGTLRFNMNFLPEQRRNVDVNAFLSMRLNSALKSLDTVLSDREWLVGNEPTAADFSCCGYLYYPEPFGFDRSAYPAIDAWLDRIAALPGWKHPYDLMPGRPSDREGETS